MSLKSDNTKQRRARLTRLLECKAVTFRLENRDFLTEIVELSDELRKRATSVADTALPRLSETEADDLAAA